MWMWEGLGEQVNEDGLQLQTCVFISGNHQVAVEIFYSGSWIDCPMWQIPISKQLPWLKTLESLKVLFVNPF